MVIGLRYFLKNSKITNYMMAVIKNPKQVVEEVTITNKGGDSGLRILSVILIVLSIVYIIMPLDYDGPMFGIIDDFMFFMAAFCFMYSQFLNRRKKDSRELLKLISLCFLVLGAVWVLLLSFTPILMWVA